MLAGAESDMSERWSQSESLAGAKLGSAIVTGVRDWRFRAGQLRAQAACPVNNLTSSFEYEFSILCSAVRGSVGSHSIMTGHLSVTLAVFEDHGL
jgi:hypothetical protein